MINWGFLGGGYVATSALAPAVHAAKNSNLYAVASRDSSRAVRLAAEKIYNSYQDLIDDPLVDLVYINLPNHLHAKWTISALNAGKNVLCEKPFAMDYPQAKAMADAALGSGKLLMEGLWTRWHPRFIRAVEIVKSGAIGPLTQIDSDFSFTAKLAANYRQEVEMGGGALFDLGPYHLHLWRAMADLSDGVQISSVERNLAASGVDLSTKVCAKIGESLILNATSSFEGKERQEIRVKGVTGEISFTQGQAFTNWHKPSKLQITSGAKSSIESFTPVDPYQLMVESISAQLSNAGVSNEHNWLLPIDQSLDVMKLLDQIRHWPK